MPVRNGNQLTVILANHMQYGKWLEFGTHDHWVTITMPRSFKTSRGNWITLRAGTLRVSGIASGQVADWNIGDTPIMRWPAKDADLQEPAKTGTKKHERWKTVSAQARTVGQGEQMPMVRPTGHDLVPQIIADVQRIVREEFQRAA